MLSARSAATTSVRGLGAAIAASLILSGCSGSAADPSSKPAVTKPAVTKPAVTKPAVATMAAAPKVGDCWNNSPGLLVGVTWEGSAAVPCSQTHNAVTYRVGTLPAGFSYETIDFDRFRTAKVVTDSCNEAGAHTYLGHGNFHPPLRVGDAVFAPSSQQWAAGARWFRCDLGFPDIKSNANYWREWQPLPVDLRAAVDADDRPFSICSDGAGKGGPTGLDTTVGKCRKGMHWVVTKSVDLAKKRGEPFPGSKPARRRAIQACHSTAEHWASWSGPVEWADGKTRASCWERWTRR